MESITNLYKNRAPRWIRCIPWDKKVKSLNRHLGIYSVTILPFLLLHYHAPLDNPYADRLYWLRPKTDAERLKLKQNWHANDYSRDWEIDEYDYDMPPYYDMKRRRAKYPEYYGNQK